MRHLMGGSGRIFQDRGVFSFDYVPPRLPNREAEYRQLALIHTSLLDAASPQHSLIRGRIGTGKTALSKRFAQDFCEEGRKRGVNVAWANVNCRQRPTPAAALYHILTTFDPKFPDRGFSLAEMTNSLRRILATRGVHLVAVLDEVDVLLQRGGQDLVYSLVRFSEDARGPTVSLVLAGQKDALLLMDEATRSTFRRTNSIILKPYTAPQLVEILQDRAAVGLRPDVLGQDVLELIAERAATEGDARFAIELLNRAAVVAESQDAPQVTGEHVRLAQGDLLPQAPEERLQELTRHQALLLIGLARALGGGKAFATTGEVEAGYKTVCEETGDKARGHTQIWTMLKELTGSGLIVTRGSGRGQTGSTTLITLPDVPPDALERRLMELHFS